MGICLYPLDGISQRRLAPYIGKELPIPDATHRGRICPHALAEEVSDFVDQSTSNLVFNARVNRAVERVAGQSKGDLQRIEWGRAFALLR